MRSEQQGWITFIQDDVACRTQRYQININIQQIYDPRQVFLIPQDITVDTQYCWIEIQ